MTWSLNASGHLQNAEAEQALVSDLRKVLSKYGAQSSVLGGTFVGRVDGLHIRDADEAAKDDAAAKEKAAGVSRSQSQAK